MKLNDVINEQQPLEEQGLRAAIRRAGTAAAQKATSKIGMSGTASRLSGSLDTQRRAQQLYVDFQNYLGHIGKKPKTATVNELRTFLQSRRIVNPPALQKANPTDPARNFIKTVFLDAARASENRQKKQQARGTTQAQPRAQAAAGEQKANYQNLERQIQQLAKMVQQLQQQRT